MKAKIVALLQRLQEPSTSYYEILENEPLLAQAFTVVLAMDCIAAADFLRLHEHHRKYPPLPFRGQPVNNTFIKLTAHGINFQLFSMAVTLFFSLQLLCVDHQVSMLFYMVEILAHYYHLELQEEFAIHQLPKNGMRGRRTTQFKPHSSRQGDDCSIYQMEPIGEAEWVYDVACKHHFHRYCLAKWLEYSTTCPLCRGILVRSIVMRRRTPAERAFSNPVRTIEAVQRIFDRHHPMERARRASSGYLRRRPDDINFAITEVLRGYFAPAEAVSRYLAILHGRGVGVGELMAVDGFVNCQHNDMELELGQRVSNEERGSQGSVD